MTLFTRHWLMDPFFYFFRSKIGFLLFWYCFLCDFVCLLTSFFFHVNFVTFFLDPGLSEVCKCSKTPIGSFKIKVSQFSFFSDFSPFPDLSGTPPGALLVTIGASGGPLGDPWRQNGVPRAAAKSV